MLEPIPFANAIAHTELFVDTSRYMDQINRFLRFFERGQFLFLHFHDLHGERLAGTLKQIQRFLGMNQEDLFQDAEIRANVDQEQRAGPLRKEACRQLGDTNCRAVAGDAFDALPMREGTRDKLLALFRRPN